MDESRRERFEEIAPTLIEPLRRFLARRTDPDTAEDVLAETLLVCWRRVDELPEEPLPWVYGVARNCLHNAERVRAAPGAASPRGSARRADRAGAAPTTPRCTRRWPRCGPRTPSCSGCGRGSS